MHISSHVMTKDSTFSIGFSSFRVISLENDVTSSLDEFEALMHNESFDRFSDVFDKVSINQHQRIDGMLDQAADKAAIGLFGFTDVSRFIAAGYRVFSLWQYTYGKNVSSLLDCLGREKLPIDDEDVTRIEKLLLHVPSHQYETFLKQLRTLRDRQTQNPLFLTSCYRRMSIVFS